MLSQHAVKKIFLSAVVLTMFAATTSKAKATCRPFTIYTKNTQRSDTPEGPNGPIGDLVIANGLIYETPTVGAAPIGTLKKCMDARRPPRR